MDFKSQKLFKLKKNLYFFFIQEKVKALQNAVQKNIRKLMGLFYMYVYIPLN